MSSLLALGAPFNRGDLTHTFVKDGILVATGYGFSEDGQRLSITTFYNRPTAIWELKIDIGITSGGPQDSVIALSATSMALWLSHNLGGPHASFFSLYKATAGIGRRGAVDNDLACAGRRKKSGGFMECFARLYVDCLLTRPFICAGRRAYLLARTSIRSRLAGHPGMATSSSPKLSRTRRVRR
ncbi:hypothetical protein EI94DRAFT_1800044 [Lactarius quietus]|nr:hypothetical protein EI94DRAFT_1800044 [Lactarius quietus]